MSELYRMEILKLATQIPAVGRLDHPDVTIEKVSRICGSKVTIDVNIAEDRIVDFAQEVKACALGQAACAIAGEHAIGMEKKTALSVRAIVKELLEDGKTRLKIPQDWQSLSLLASAHEHRTRHSSIMLIFDALIAAFEAKKTNDPSLFA